MEHISKDSIIAQMERLASKGIINDIECQHIKRCIHSMSDQQLYEFKENAIKECQ